MCISKRPCFAWGVPECRDKLKAVARLNLNEEEARQFAACSDVDMTCLRISDSFAAPRQLSADSSREGSEILRQDMTVH